MSASDWQVISQGELVDPRIKSGWIRAYCPIHGGDHQRSLSINEQSGFGQCHQCGVQVVVAEINPKAVEHITRGKTRRAAGDIRVRDPRYIARAAATQASQHTASQTPYWQVKEVALLRSLHESMVSRLHDERARAYIAQRGIAFETVQQLGVGYIPDMPFTGRYAPLARWADHIMFPVSSPDGDRHYAGRSLRLWEPGMDEEEHKQLLDVKKREVYGQAKEARAHKAEEKAKRLDREAGLYLRYYKTHSHGWFNFAALDAALHDTGQVVFCEGAFDALALIEAGIIYAVAIVGTVLERTWIPPKMGHVTLAFDGDESGREKSQAGRDTLYRYGFDVTDCPAPAEDGKGKDWSERYRRFGLEGLAPVLSVAKPGGRTNAEPNVSEGDDPASVCCLCGAEPWTVTEENAVYCKACWHAQGHESADDAKCCVCGDFVDDVSEDGRAWCAVHYHKMLTAAERVRDVVTEPEPGEMVMTHEHFLNTVQQSVAQLPDKWTVELIEGDIEAYKQRVLAEHRQALAQHGDKRTQADSWREVRRELARQGYYEQLERGRIERQKRIDVYQQWRSGPIVDITQLKTLGSDGT